MSYEELVCKIKKAYLDKDLKNAHKYWCEMYDLLDSKLNETDDEVKRYEYYKEFNSYMDKFSNDEVYDITDYGKKQAYRQMEIERTHNILDKSCKLYTLTNDEKMIELDDWLSFYEWCILKDENNEYCIYDLQTNTDILKSTNIKDIIERVVGRALDYEINETDHEFYDEHYSQYLETLYQIAKENGIDEKYLEGCKESIKELNIEMLEKEIEYREEELKTCAYGKRELYELEDLKNKLEKLERGCE